MRLILLNGCHYHYGNKIHSSRIFPAIRTASSRRPKCVRMSSTAGPGRVGFRQASAVDREGDKKEKIIVVLGATGSGKSRLSIDLATLFPAEIINSDKMQLYQGLDITTNKLPLSQRRGVPHHLLGEFDAVNGEISAVEYRDIASKTISDISSRRKTPVLAGGSNSYLYALLAARIDPDAYVFGSAGSNRVAADLLYNCCFLWVDVAPPVLDAYLEKRVDDMLDSEMFEELAEFFASEGVDSETRAALRKAIGVPEFAQFFRRFPGVTARPVAEGMRGTRIEAYEEAIKAIKDNTCQLAKRQVGKIQRLRAGGWDLRRLDATDVFQQVLAADGGKAASDGAWRGRVLEPSVEIVRRFLEAE